MIKLNLETKNKEQEKIKEYLQENTSEILADKINNGVKVVKDNKSLLNKKDLNGFWNYATNEARKLTEKSQNGAYVDDETVYGWAIHYFEEDSIEGILYNEDGSEFKPVIKATTNPISKVEYKAPEKKKENTQENLFDFFNTSNSSENNSVSEENEEFDEEEAENENEEIEAINEVKNDYPKYYLTYLKAKEDNQNSVVITKVGDFFEAYNEDANTLSNCLGLILTARTFNNEKIKMVGFPIHIYDKYVEKIREKYSLTIIENDEISTFPQKQTIQENNLLIDTSTGEVISKENKTFDKFQLETIKSLFDNEIIIK